MASLSFSECSLSLSQIQKVKNMCLKYPPDSFQDSYNTIWHDKMFCDLSFKLCICSFLVLFPLISNK